MRVPPKTGEWLKQKEVGVPASASVVRPSTVTQSIHDFIERVAGVLEYFEQGNVVLGESLDPHFARGQILHPGISPKLEACAQQSDSLFGVEGLPVRRKVLVDSGQHFFAAGENREGALPHLPWHLPQIEMQSVVRV